MTNFGSKTTKIARALLICIALLIFLVVSFNLTSCGDDEVVLSSISATYNQGNKVIYTSTSLDSLKADLKVVGKNNDGSEFDITNYTLQGELKAGSSEITVSYESANTTFTVNVTEVSVTSIRIDSLPTKTNYVEAESVDLSGLVLVAVYNDGSEKEITDYQCNLESVSLKDNKIIVSYSGFEKAFDITVEKKVVSLAVSKMPTKVSYIVGERLDLSGLEIKATFIDGTSQVIEATTNKQTGDILNLNDSIICSKQDKSIEVELDISYVEYEDFLLSYAYRQSKVRSYEGETIEYKISKYVGKASKLVIPKDCAGIPITEIENLAFENCNVTMITVGSNITYVYSDSFKGCENTVIATDFSEKPEGWTDWNEANYPVVWAYTSIVIDEYFDYGVSNEKVYIVGYKGLSPVVIIPEKINGYPVVSVTATFSENKKLTNIILPETLEAIDDYAFYNCYQLTSITIPDSVTSIGKDAFFFCSRLESVAIGDSVTTIGENAFEDCSSLTSITIPYSVTTIGRSAFEDCDSLINITIPDSVTTIGRSAFSSCSNLTSVTIGNGVTSIGKYAFRLSKSLTSINVDADNKYYKSIDGNLYSKDGKILIQYASGKKDTSFEIPSSVTSICEDAFYYCTSLTSITIPDSVTSIGSSAFCNCSSLTSMTIPSSVTSIGGSAFFGCSKLANIICESEYRADKWSSDWKNGCNATVTYLNSETEITTNSDFNYIVIDGNAVLTKYKGDKTEVIIPDIIDNTYKVVGFGEIFRENKAITSITIPNSVTSIGDAFYDCTSLTSVTIPDSVTSIGKYAFYNCSSLNSVYISDISAWCNISFEGYYANPLWCANNLYLNNTLVTNLVIPSTVTEIKNYAFSDCDSITSITIPDSVTSIGDYVFSSCSNLTSVTIGDSVTSIGYSAFEYCSSLTSVTIGNSVTKIGDSAFFYCFKLTSVTIGDRVTSIGSSAFYNCSSLTNITIPNSITFIGSYAFGECSKLESLDIPQSATSLGEGLVSNCTSLRKIILPTTVDNLSGEFFAGCSSLAEIYTREGNELYRSIDGNLYDASAKILIRYMSNSASSTFIIPSGVTKIANDAFSGVTNLKSVIIPDSVITIGDYAFYNCFNLTNVIIGNGVTSIGSYAFRECNNLTSIIIPNSVTFIGGHAFYNCSELTSVTIGNSVTTIGGSAFYNCKNLTSITIPDSVTTIGGSAFSSCSNLTSVTIGNGVTSIGKYAFEYCISLTSITIPSSVTLIEDCVFRGCSKIASIGVDADNKYYKSIDGNLYSKDGKILIRYASDKKDTSFEIPNSVTSIEEYAFSYCSNLTSITIPDSVTSIESYAFYHCSSLTSITIPSSVTLIEYSAYGGCSNLENIICNSKYKADKWSAYWKIGCNATVTYLNSETEITTNSDFNYIVVDGNAVLTKYKGDKTEVVIPDIIDNTYTVVGFDIIFKENKTITSITIPDSVTSIEREAFYNCFSLTSITIGDSVTTIGENAFYNCENITSVTIPNSVISIGTYAFCNCYSLNSVYIGDISAWCNISFGNSASNPLYYASNLYLNNSLVTNLVIPSTVTEIKSYAFYECDSITSITIDNGATSIGAYAFYNCSNLITSITIPSSVTFIGNNAFYDCYKITSVTIPSSVTYISDSAFSSCDSLTSINVDANNKYYKTIDGSLYSKDEKTLIQYAIGKKDTSFEIPSSVTTIGYSAFEDCSKLTSVTIGDSVTSIGENAFKYCSSLTSITISDSVITIGENAFDNCPRLHIFFEGVYAEFSTNWNPDNRPVYYGSVMYKSSAEFYVEILGNEAKIVKYIGNGGNVVIPDAIVIDSRSYKVVEICEGAFSGINNVTSILIGAEVRVIDENAFDNCQGLLEVYIAENNETYKIEDGIVYSFDGKELLFTIVSNEKILTIPDGVEIIHREAFINAKAEEIILPASVRVIESLAFYGNETLKKITVSEDNESYVSVDGILFDKEMTTIYYYPVLKDGIIYNVPASVNYVEAHCFVNQSLKVVFVANNGVNVRNEAFTYNQTVVLNEDIFLFANKQVLEKATSVALVDGVVYALCSDNSAVVIYNPNENQIPTEITFDSTTYNVAQE